MPPAIQLVLSHSTFAVLLAATMFTVDRVKADFSILTDRSPWELASGLLYGDFTFEEDFENFVQDIDFSFGITDAPNGFSVGHSGASGFRNLIDVKPFDFDDGNGTNSISAFVDSSNVVTVTLDSPSVSVGFDAFSGFDHPFFNVEVSYFDPTGSLIATAELEGASSEFLGIITLDGTEVSRIEFVANSNLGFRLDNFSVVSISTVPEPGSFAFGCIISFLLSLSLTGRKRRNR